MCGENTKYSIQDYSGQFRSLQSRCIASMW